ncbi:unnamed protein product [Schistosoma mattheei]|uniref:Uncharacterized protein n=1 Tax=Schistosoma mattheei TaxID=31246 RepID=A0A3P8FC49_9TREM|nr:unnamed protein product [Schistosoma mattheei]
MWNLGCAFRPIWESSAECTYIPELIFTLGLEPSTVSYKHHRVVHLATEYRYIFSLKYDHWIS